MYAHTSTECVMCIMKVHQYHICKDKEEIGREGEGGGGMGREEGADRKGGEQAW